MKTLKNKIITLFAERPIGLIGGIFDILIFILTVRSAVYGIDAQTRITELFSNLP